VVSWNICPIFGIKKNLATLVSSPPAIEETGAMGRENESCQGIGW
jgi:hypothetical protein